MKAIEYLKAKKRLTKDCLNCVDCPLSVYNNGRNLVCSTFEEKYPEKAVEIVEKWSKEHPARTRQSEMLKLFPDAFVCSDGYIQLCPKSVNKAFKCPKELRCWDCRKKYWLEEIEGE